MSGPREPWHITEKGVSLLDSIRRVAAAAWLLGGVAWLVKLTLIFVNGGSNTDEGVVAVAFLAGVAFLVAAGAVTGFVLLRRWNTWLAAAGVPLGVAITLVGINVIDGVLQGIVPASGWFDEEVGILGAAVLAVLAGLAFVARERAPRAAAV